MVAAKGADSFDLSGSDVTTRDHTAVSSAPPRGDGGLRSSSAIVRRRLLAALVLLLPTVSTVMPQVTVELRSPEDFSTFLPLDPDCRDTSPRSCRGLLWVDPPHVPPLRGVYVGFAVTNEGSADRDDVWVTLGGFADEDPPGNLVRIAPGEAENPGDPSEQWYGAYRIGPLTAGETAMAFFLLQVTDPTMPLPIGPETRPEVTVWDGVPFQGSVIPANPLLPPCPDLGRMCVMPSGAVEVPFIYARSLTAFALSSFLMEPIPAGPAVGDLVEVTVVGDMGQPGSVTDFDRDGDVDSLMVLAPAALASWPANRLELVRTEVTLSGDNACGLTDCTCSSDPPAPGECVFGRQDGGPPACEERAAGLPGIPSPTCVVLEVTDNLQVIDDDQVPKNYVAVYTFVSPARSRQRRSARCSRSSAVSR